MERNYGLGLTGLIHPVTKAFNHEAVIERRGGRSGVVYGNTKDVGLHTALGKVHGLMVGAEAENKWMTVDGKDFDAYDSTSFWYGFIVSMQEGFKNDGASNCFYSAFSVVETADFLVQDSETIWETWNFYDLLVYQPTHISGNFASAYE